MATRQGNIKGVKWIEEPLGAGKGGICLITFDLVATAFTTGSDTISLGGGGYDGGVTTTDTLETIMSKRRRDGLTVTLVGVAGNVFPGLQGSTLLFAQSFAISSHNLASGVLATAATGGSGVSSTSATWDRACGICVAYTAS